MSDKGHVWNTSAHVSQSCPLFFFVFKFAGHGRDTYLLFLFSFNCERLSSYLLFTLLNLILGLYSNF